MWVATLAAVLLASLQLCDAKPHIVRHMERSIEARQSATQLPKMNITEWNTATGSACMTALSKLNGKASNPAGMAVCYNLPFLNNSTGLFQADLRLYMISAPSGDFSGVPAQNVTVGLQYFGASVQPVNASSLGKREAESEFSSDMAHLSWPVTKREDGVLETRDTPAAPVMVQAYMFVGQVNRTTLATVTTTAQLEGLLIPMVTLSGITSSKSVINTTLSSDEATFVNGVFADALTPTQLAQVAAAASASATALAKKQPFKVPGMRILIFPVGGIVTGVWALILMGTIAYGTIGRMQFREQFRKRSARGVGTKAFYGGL